MSTPVVRRASFAIAGLTATALVSAAVPFANAAAPNAAGSHAAKASPAASSSLASKPKGRQPKPSGKVEQTWAPAYMATGKDLTYTEAQAVSMAKRFNIVAGVASTFKPYLNAMREANPNVTLLAYSNATFINANKVNDPKYHASEFARDKNGHEITSPQFGTVLMNPHSARWRKQATNECLDNAQGYDGCLVDLLTMGIYSKGFITALPVNPHTHKTYTQQAWRAGLIKLAHEYVQRDSKKIIVGNSVSNYFRYWDENPSSQSLVGALANAQMEDFLRGAGDPYSKFPNTATWLQNIDVIRSIEKSHRTGVFSTKLWGPAGHHPSKATVAQWQGYAMASFLMRADGRSYFAFTKARSKAGAMEKTLPYTMPKSLGKPTDAMKLTGGVYLRKFHNGKVLVNPTGSTVRVHLAAHYTDLQGKRIKSLVMHAHTGNVLIRRAG